MITLEKISKSFGQQILFEDISLAVHRGERIGLIGRNGSGKSTLMKIIANEVRQDSGEIKIPRNYRLGYLQQHLKFRATNLIDELLLDLHNVEEDQSYLAKKYLLGLGFKESDFSRSPLEFSGGFQIRLTLAKLLLQKPDMLLLDEPSNYLDIKGLSFLRGFLKGFQGEMILITHDREFLDSVITTTAGITRQRVRKIPGKTIDYFNQIRLEEEQHEKERLKIDKRRAEIQKFVDRFKAKASKATAAQARMKLLEKMGRLDALSDESTSNIRFPYQQIESKVLIDIKNLTFGYVKESPLITNLSLVINRGDKVAIIGENGKGKSTLLNLLAGELTKDGGEIRFPPKVAIGHMGQSNIDRLLPTNSIVDEIITVSESVNIKEARSIAGALLFEGDLALKKISVLSGGERARVMLGKIIASKTNLLFLDEPTNHLDMESIEELLQAIDDYAGSVLFVTHSERMIRELATKLIVFTDSGIDYYDGEYDDYLSYKERYMAQADVSTDANEETALKKGSREHKRIRSELVQKRSRELSPLKREQGLLEENIFRMEEEIKKNDATILELSLQAQSKGREISELSVKNSKLQKDVDDQFTQFTIVSEKIEEIEEFYRKELDNAF